MSANFSSSVAVDDTYNTTCFHMDIPIPDYLIAIAIGNIAYTNLGGRAGIYTEPAMMQAAVQELADLNTLLDTAEAYVGTPYIWGVYNILVLPPSFPFGGMENPLMTFASPTIITGTKSQVFVAIHEICHSWTGNQVTMNNWEDFWLNEGFTTFIERKVSSRLYGNDFAKVEALLGNTSLAYAMNITGYNNTYSTIHPVLAGGNPDDSFSEVPYEKGFQLLAYIETLIGKK